MTAKTQVLAILSVLFVTITSCRKDLIVAPESQPLETAIVSSDATINDAIETAPPIHTPVTTFVNGNCAGYYQTLPAKYYQTSKSYPLIIFIHGIGELGTGVTRLNCCGVPYWAKRGLLPASYTVNGVHYSPIYISPQFRVRPSAADVQSVINYAVNKYRVDRSRIYVTGLSMGGGSTYDFSVVDGQNVTAVVPVCGGTRPTTSIARNLASKNIPVWGIYSDGDHVVPLQWGKDWFSWMRSVSPSNSNLKMTVYSGLSHNSTWGRAFNPQSKTDGYNVYEWLLRFQKGKTPAPGPIPTPTPTPTPTPKPTGGLVANAGADQSISTAVRKDAFLNGSKSTAVSGTWITKYTWTKVSGPSATIAVASLTQAHANGLVTGTYVFRLTVTNNTGATAYDDLVVKVNGGGSTPGPSPTPPPTTSGNRAPLASAGTDQYISIAVRKDAFLNGSLSKDTDGWITKYTWSKVSGPSASIAVSSQTQAHANGLSLGTYIFRMTVTDNKGATSYDDVRVVVGR